MIKEKNLRKLGFILAVIGIAILLSLLLFKPKEISSIENINNLTINSKVLLKGLVESERDFGNFKIWGIKGIEVVCDCKESYLDKEVEVIGVVEEFNDKKQVRVLKVFEVEK